jgi:hypothetical protein
MTTSAVDDDNIPSEIVYVSTAHGYFYRLCSKPHKLPRPRVPRYARTSQRPPSSYLWLSFLGYWYTRTSLDAHFTSTSVLSAFILH